MCLLISNYVMSYFVTNLYSVFLLISNYVMSYFVTSLYSVFLIAVTHLSKQDAAQKPVWLLVATRASILFACLVNSAV